jgi:hypothetical protein
VTAADGFVDRYVALWNQNDPLVRRREVVALWTDDAVYADPVISVRGHDALEALIGTAREEVGAGRMVCLRRTDSHHDVLRFQAEVVLPGRRAAVMRMTTLVVRAEDERVRTAYVFFDRMTEAWRRIVHS